MQKKQNMRKLLVFLSLFVAIASMAQSPAATLSDKFVLVIHGGAGTILKSQMTPDKEKAYTEALNAALEKGYAVLKEGGSALDAVETSIRFMEDNPLFNAGKGAVFTNEGKNELDASMMDGKTLSAGSVAGITIIKHPVSAARAVMEKSPHVMMAGGGAEQFAKEQGLEIVDPSYFYTESRWRSLKSAMGKDSSTLKIKLPINYEQLEKFEFENQLRLDTGGKKESSLKQPENNDYKYGTVGAVALDRYGNLAAATSTGGMTNKKFGRIGDSPVIGAGTYASNSTAAISCTGWGEFYIRLVLAKTVSDMMEFGNMKLKDAADEMVMKRLPVLGGDGGLIAVDKDGNIAMPFCTAGMYRGFVREDGKKHVSIYKE